MAATETLLIQLQTADGDWIDVGLMRSVGETNWFETSEAYWSTPYRPVLGQVFEEQGPGWRPNARVAIPHWFSHLLPEGRLRSAVAAASALPDVREFQLLRRLGADDLPGAVRAVEATEAGDALPPAPGEAESSGSGEEPLLKFSLAGLQLKFSVFQNSDRGLTLPVSGQAGNMILKMPDGRPGHELVPEAEYAAMRLARQVGIRTPDVSLVDALEIPGLRRWAQRNPGLSLAVARFDRAANDRRVHAEELAQVMNIPTARDRVRYTRANFETVATYIAALAGTAWVHEVVDRIVLNVLVGNGDAHLKNWAVIYPDGRHAQLSPVYDVVPTVLYVPNDDLGLNLDGQKQFERVTVQSFRALGERSGLGAVAAEERASDAVRRVLENWPLLEQLLPMSMYAQLTDRLQSLALVAESGRGRIVT